MKKITITVVALILVIGSFLLWRHYAMAKDSKLAATVVTDRDSALLEEGGYYGKAVVLLIDGTEIYCGKDRLARGEVEDFVLKTMELNKLKRVDIAASTSVHFGDVVALMDRLKKRGIKATTVSTRPVPIGARLPAIDW